MDMVIIDHTLPRRHADNEAEGHSDAEYGWESDNPTASLVMNETPLIKIL